MKLYSTADKSSIVSLEEAVLKGLADNNGLFMPLEMSPFEPDFFTNLSKKSFPEIAFEVSKKLIGNEIEEGILKEIVSKAVNFDAPIVKITEQIYSLELFHGPTLAFKDFGARFMAGLLNYFARNQNEKLVILVATSGDTGGAVAHSFLGSDKIDVIILYPSGKVSALQEKQLTTLGKNVSALEIKGTFDDCQHLVKQAFSDKELQSKIKLTSANSINIARLIPQSFYYFYAYSRLPEASQKKDIVFSVPSGNFGNLTAGLLAKSLGLPVKKFIAATNTNDTVPKYLESGIYEPKPSKATVSNAMDVGSPNNFARMNDLFEAKLENFKKQISGYSFTDQQTLDAVKHLFQEFSYVADPHGAVAYLGLREYMRDNQDNDVCGVFLETAHPAKFLDSVQGQVSQRIEIPERLKEVLNKQKSSLILDKDFEQFKQHLLNR